jgi:hypothetical protein
MLSHVFSYELKYGPEEHQQLDHVCHNKKCVNPDHLRQVSNKQNTENKGRLNSNNTSGFQGVWFDKYTNRWAAEVKHHGQKFWLGRFTSLEEAAEAARTKRLELFTHNDLDRATDD